MNRKINIIPVVRTKIGEQDRRTIMEKHIMGENRISYTLGEDGLYYPDLYLPEVTEELKRQDQMAWVGRMNNIRACAEEMILKEIVCE